MSKQADRSDNLPYRSIFSATVKYRVWPQICTDYEKKLSWRHGASGIDGNMDSFDNSISLLKIIDRLKNMAMFCH